MPEQDLLADALLDAAAVEPVGDEPVLLGVLLDVGVEEVERDATDLRLPERGRTPGVPAMSMSIPTPSTGSMAIARGSRRGKRSCCHPRMSSSWVK